MKVTRQEFEQKIGSLYPNKIFCVDSVFTETITTAYNDHPYWWDADIFDRLCHADYVWKEGEVIKDKDGLFNSVSVATVHIDANYTAAQTEAAVASATHTHGFKLEEWVEPKCQCGKEKHGFAKHSDWCDIKE